MARGLQWKSGITVDSCNPSDTDRFAGQENLMRGITSTVCALALALGLGGACKRNDAGADTLERAEVAQADSPTQTAVRAVGDEIDVAVADQIRQRIVADTVLSADARNVSVVPEGGIVILKGTVHSRAERAMINAIAIGVVGRKNVLDRLEIVR